ncbi:hypothetical protein jhhlp_002748 [Lomentospora prolificans]|uniref:Uncharacterized protein n=1 Tax=Lomentospora prolificans TaxID=41688 RepID=A0A2N3NEX5_9PEZI|nr:hypothetical protein jhhlp_002748 [Lomentospora prolificans]
MARSQLLVSLLAALAAVPASHAQIVISTVVETFNWRDPFGAHQTPPGFEVVCESKKTFRALQHIIADLEHELPMGLAPWSDAIFYFFGGRPYPGTWEGVDNKGEQREIMRMEYADVPPAVRAWIAEQKKNDDPEALSKFLFGVFEKPKNEGDKIAGTAKPRKDGSEASDDEKVLMFAAGALYEILPLWVADGSDCQAELLNLENYQPYPEDNKIVAWPIEHTWPDDENGDRSMEFTIKAQILRETEEGRSARLQREKEAEEELLRQEEEAKKLAEEEAAKAAEESETVEPETATEQSEAQEATEDEAPAAEKPTKDEADKDSNTEAKPTNTGVGSDKDEL